MNPFKESFCENFKSLKLIGSQVNPTPRLDKTVLEFDNRSTRPCSSAPSCRIKTECKTKVTRPKSADLKNLAPSKCKCLQWSFSFNKNNLSGDSSLTVSHFTHSSSELLQNLIEKEVTVEKPLIEYKDFFTEGFFKPSGKNPKLENTIAWKYLDEENRDRLLTKESLNKESLELQKTSQKNNIRMKEHSDLRNQIAVKTELPGVSDDTKNCSSCVKNNLKSFWQEANVYQRKENFEKPKVVELEIQRMNANDKNKSDNLKSPHSNNEANILKNCEKNKEEILSVECKVSPRNIKKCVDIVEHKKNVIEYQDFQQNVEMEKIPSETKCHETLVRFMHNSDEIDKGDKNVELNEKNVTDGIHKKIDLSDSTYEEIVHLLQTLDEEDSESLNSEQKELESAIIFTSPREKIDFVSTVSSYLEKVEKDNNSLYSHHPNGEKWNSMSFSSPRLEELLNKNSVELAQEVFSLKIQIEDQKKGIKLLKDTLAELKEANKVGKLEHQEALHKVTSDAEALVQRHQKFIKQLLNEKKNLNETVSKLVQDLKSGEEKYKRNIKALEEKHLVEIKRAKEVQAVADKMKREKWMENKTQKIKEMTVRGLEPELSRMAAHQQEEITELRNLHKAELEALELRAARRNSELMDELRAELTKEKERSIAKETASLRAALEKNYEDEKVKLQHYCQNLKERIRKQEESSANQELEFQQRLIDYKQEEEKKKQKLIREHQENLEEIRREHLVEIKHLKESVEVEKEVLLNNYKKQTAAKNLEREAELHQQYKRERDKEIELVIETLEKESAQIQSELNAANENKLKRLKDKMAAEIKEIEESEAALKVKLAEAKTKLSENEDFITELNSQIRQLQTELNFVKKSCEEMSVQKAKLKEIIHEEFENTISSLVREKENLEKDIVVLKELHLKELAKKDQQNFQAKYDMQKELTGVYRRIKTAVSKKEKIIESLRKENETANQRCRQLEIMLDQQRRNLLLH